MSVDINHAEDKQTRHSHTTVETGGFHAEFVAVKAGVDTLRDLRYKLGMMGAAIDGVTYVYEDD
ncbi:hypothetical protein ACHAXS_000143, partial [Conticribra weissflogii]